MPATRGSILGFSWSSAGAWALAAGTVSACTLITDIDREKIPQQQQPEPQQPEPEHAEQEHPEPPSNCSSTVHMSEATAAEITDKSEPDGPTDEQQSHPRES